MPDYSDAKSSPLNDFFRRLAAAPRRILISDYDGTLAPFRVERGQAIPYPSVKEALQGIVAGGARLALITGRTAHDLAALVDFPQPLEIWGSHGSERLHRDGRLERFPLTEGQRAGLERALEQARRIAPEERIEVKYGCLALHWRGEKPEVFARWEAGVRRSWEGLTGSGELALLRFDSGLELRATNYDKGTAVSTILNETPDAVAAYLGDDLTDEDAFRAIKGRGLAVLVRAEPRETAADIRLSPPEELLEFLSQWRSAATG
jgi:trehalose-phosphatase